MSAELERPLVPGDSGRFAAMFDSHAAHLYDYCTSRLADVQEAADATQATLILAYSLSGRLTDADRLRAWLFALARRECASEQPVRAALPNSASDWTDPVREAEPATVEMRLADFHARKQATGHAAAARLAALPSGEREVLDLVHRHHVSPAELPAILGLPASRAQALLAAAIENFERSEQDGELKVTDVSAIPLATVPSWVWRRTAGVVLDPDLASYCESLAGSAGKLGLDGFPAVETLSQTPPARKLVLASAVLGALLLTPATAGAVLFSYYGGSPQAISHAISQVFGPPSPGPQVSGGTRPPLPPTLFPKKKAKGVLPVVGPGHSQPIPHPSGSKSNRPSPSPTRRVSPTGSPFPSSSSSGPSPSPTATPTPTSTPTATPS